MTQVPGQRSDFSLDLTQYRVHTTEPVVDPDLLRTLARESSDLRADAKQVLVDTPYLDGGTRLVSQARYKAGGAGPELRRLHEHSQIAAGLATFFGCEPTPTRASFIYYEPGDHVGLHQDVSSCTVVALLHIDGSPSETLIHPELDGLNPMPFS